MRFLCPTFLSWLLANIAAKITCVKKILTFIVRFFSSTLGYSPVPAVKWRRNAATPHVVFYTVFTCDKIIGGDLTAAAGSAIMRRGGPAPMSCCEGAHT
jgi:hypothetical protein